MATASVLNLNHCLRNKTFDLVFVAGIPILAIAAGLISHISFAYQDYVFHLFIVVLTLDLWVLGYHHVIATFTRLTFDKPSVREHRFLIFGLPLLIMAGVSGGMLTGGAMLLTTVYIHWQFYHYTRQSWGILRAYERKAQSPVDRFAGFNQFAFYAIPAGFFLVMSGKSTGYFLGSPLFTVPVSQSLSNAILVVCGILFVLWLANSIIRLQKGHISLIGFAYELSHYLIFFVGYVLIQNFNYGWLTINAWHNAQYLLFVWLFNTSRYHNKPDPERPFISYISQSQRVAIYFLITLLITTLVYLTLNRFITGVLTPLLENFDFIQPGHASLFALMLVYQTINFHHYIVDSVIWKMRSKKIQQTLKIS